MNYPTIYIICHKFDFFLTEILVSSIRFYYPDVEINLIKDEIHGYFSTTELEKYFQVNIVQLEKKKFGWTSAKIFLLLSKTLAGEKIMLLDSDVVFVGRVLDRLSPYLDKNDFIVSPEYRHKPISEGFTKNYYDFEWFKNKYPDLSFPGFTFNTGNIVITTGILNKSDVEAFFDVSEFPYWTDLGRKMLPTRDQSLLNVLLPLKESLKLLRLKSIPFMWWYRDDEVKELPLSDVKTGVNPFLIHWAGGIRVPFVPAMRRGDVLLFFQKEYYSKLPMGVLRFYWNYVSEGFKSFLSPAKLKIYTFEKPPKNIWNWLRNLNKH